MPYKLNKWSRSSNWSSYWHLNWHSYILPHSVGRTLIHLILKNTFSDQIIQGFYSLPWPQRYKIQHLSMQTAFFFIVWYKKQNVSFRSAQEQYEDSVMVNHLHPSVQSQRTMQSVGCSDVKHITLSDNAVDESGFSSFQENDTGTVKYNVWCITVYSTRLVSRSWAWPLAYT